MHEPSNRKLKFIGCEIIYREACRLAATSRDRVDVEFLRKGLHDLETADMKAAIQERIDAVDPADGYEAILLGYARCNDGVVGLQARQIPLVIPRAHDCITFFFGSRGAYKEHFDACPGTYYLTTGWSERNAGYEFGNPQLPGRQGVMQKLGLADSYEQMVAKYGKENADFIAATLGDWRSHYSRLMYIEMGVCDEKPFIEAARARAAASQWAFEQRSGDWTLLQKLFDGRWDDDFVIVPPGAALRARNDGAILSVGPRDAG